MSTVLIVIMVIVLFGGSHGYNRYGTTALSSVHI
jgi:hypothetical protein